MESEPVMPVTASRKTLILGLMLALACLLTVVTALAASFSGVLAATIMAQAGAFYPMSASMSDSFSGTGSFAGRVLASGQPWMVNSGTWSTVSGNLAKCSSSSVNQVASLPWLDVPTRVEATLSGSSTYTGGIAMHLSGDGKTGTVLQVKSSGQVNLIRLTSGTATTWASASSSPTGTWSLSYTDGVYTVKRNSSTVLAYTAPTSVEANTRVGLYSSGSSTNLRWASFSAVSL